MTTARTGQFEPTTPRRCDGQPHKNCPHRPECAVDCHFNTAQVDRAAPVGTIIVRAAPATGFAHFKNGTAGTTTLVIGEDKDQDWYTKYHSLPNGWRPQYWNPAHWYLNIARTDAIGRRWMAAGGEFVTNDFGDLVQVPA